MAGSVKAIPFPAENDSGLEPVSGIGGIPADPMGAMASLRRNSPPPSLPQGKARHFRLGEYLLNAGVIDVYTLDKALALQKRNGKKLGETLIEMQATDEDVVARYLARQWKIPFIRLDRVRIRAEVLKLIPFSVAGLHSLIPVKRDPQGLYLAMVDPKSAEAINDARLAASMNILPVCSPRNEILRAIASNYGEQRKGLPCGLTGGLGAWPAEAVGRRPAGGRPPRILVADDSATMRRIISVILVRQGYEILTAENGLEALQIALREQPDLMVTDHLMPDMDGVTLIRRLKSGMGSRRIPIVMLSANEEALFQQEVLSAGADRFLKKPLDTAHLLGMVRELLYSQAKDLNIS